MKSKQWIFKKALFISSIFPSVNNPHSGIFVKNLIVELALYIREVLVVKPTAVHKITLPLKNRIDNIQIVQKAYLPNPLRKSILFKKTFNYYLKPYLISKEIKTLNEKPNFVYSHFIIPSFVGHRYSLLNKIPHIIAIGEDSNYLKQIITNYGKRKILNIFDNASLIISVSENNKKILLDYYPLLNNKIHIVPNAVNLSVFTPIKEKVKIREKHNIPSDKFIISFVGHFNERKGAYRVLQAIENIPDVFGIFMGSGQLLTYSNKIIKRGIFEKEIVAELLSCSNLFVLPTQAEGMSNAINEAMACGLPIISSNINSVREQLEGTGAILTDPNNIDEIRRAIIRFKENKILREKVGNNVYNKVKTNSIENRAKTIIQLIKEAINEQ